MSRVVLITGARAPVAVDLARSFRDAGYETHLADCVNPFAARCLRPRVSLHRFASPRYDFARFRRDMAELVGRLDPEIIIPTCEEVFYLSAAAATDGYADRLFAPPLADLRRLHSKWEFTRLAQECGVPVPETFLVSIPTELAAVPLPLREMVLKPEYSRFSTQTLIRPTESEIARLQISVSRRYVAQRFVSGEEICSWAAVRNGKVVAFAAYRPVWRHGRAAIAFESVVAPGVAGASHAIAEATGMTGHLSLDLMVSETGAAVAMECNPRAVSGVHLFDADPAMARAILGKGVAPPPPLMVSGRRTRYLAPAMAALGFPKAVVGGRFREFLAVWRRGRDVTGRTGNRLPFLGTLLDALRFTATGLIYGRTTTEQTTANIEWNGENFA
ncbi:MAG: hypothetical protein H7Y38_05945 [Armatimonadetes bacterium]|nr:hypothetical protein [Armatimonadota bacterium]